MKKIILLLLICFLVGCSGSKNEPLEEIADYSAYFTNMNGCAVFYSPKEDKYTYFNKGGCMTRYSPYSTFKIIGVLEGLKYGVVENQNSKMHYNGGKYPFEAWEKDMGLKEAFQTSCVWYFRQLIDAVGEENMKKDIDALSYGNCDISEWNGNEENGISDTNGFWLASSLQISPKESVDVVANIFEGKTDYSQADIEILSDVMQSDVSGIYGKTGTAKDNKAWYTGYCTTENGNIYFSVYISDCTDKNVAGADAKQIAVNIINDNYILAYE